VRQTDWGLDRDKPKGVREVKNAHERFDKLLYRRQTEKTATNLRVLLDVFVGEESG